MLEIREVRDRISPVAVAQYHQFPEFNENGRRTELIRGVVIEKMPKSPLHASIAKLLYDSLHASVPAGYSVRQDQPLTFRDSEPEPDIAIVSGTVQDYRASHPVTAILVLSRLPSAALGSIAKRPPSTLRQAWRSIGFCFRPRRMLKSTAVRRMENTWIARLSKGTPWRNAPVFQT